VTESIEEIAARFILKRDADGANDADEQELASWLEESPRHQVVYWRLEDAWSRADRIRALGPMPGAPVPFIRRVQHWGGRAGIAVAASILPIVAGWLLMRPAPPVPVVYSTEVGGQKLVTLEDGTVIDLNTDTQIEVRYSDSQRLVTLDRGEAYFQVAHDPGRPLIVRSGNQQVTDIGTRFVIRRNADTFFAAVAEGKVMIAGVQSTRQGSSAVLSAGDHATVSARSQIAVAHDMDYVQAALSWRSGLLRLDGLTLGEAVAQFNRYNDRKLVVSDPALSSLKIGGLLDAHNPDAFVRLLGSVYHLRAEQRGDSVKIIRSSL